MANITFEKDIKPIFAPFAPCMKNVVLGDEDGTENLDLGSYEIVKRFYYQIQVAIHGYDLEDGQPLPGTKPLLVKDGPDKGKYVVAPHPMPPGSRRLAQQDIDLYDQWVAEGLAS